MKEQAKKNTAINHTIPPLEQIIRKKNFVSTCSQEKGKQ
jgi:hypothetical protein